MTEGEILGAMERLGLSRAEAETVVYLGDGVYATYDGIETIWLRTLEGNRIALEPRAMTALGCYAEQFSI